MRKKTDLFTFKVCGSLLLLSIATTLYVVTSKLPSPPDDVDSVQMSSIEENSARISIDLNAAESVDIDTPVASQAFSGRLLSAMKQTNEKSIIFSSLSVEYALLLAAVGSRGATKTEFETIFSANDDCTLTQTCNDSKQGLTTKYTSMKQICDSLNSKYTQLPIVTIANRIWVNKGYVLSPEYENTVSKSLVTPINFGNAGVATNTINSWVEQQTKGKIQKLLPNNAINGLTRIIITNAIYFKGEFKNAFPKKKTKQNTPFYANYHRKKKTTTVSMMSKPESKELYFEWKGNEIVALPYEGCSIELIIALPKEKNSQSITATDLKEIHSNLRRRKINFKLPKFKIEKQYKLVPILKALGIKQAFDENMADFSGISDAALPNGLYISDIIHKAMIEVDEVGTVASAATAIVMQTRSMKRPMPIPNVICDHPFEFYLFDTETEILLFSGRYSGDS